MLDLWASPEVTTKTILLVTHSIEEAVAMSDRVVVIRPTRAGSPRPWTCARLARPRRADAPAVRETVDRMYGLLA